MQKRGPGHAATTAAGIRRQMRRWAQEERGPHLAVQAGRPLGGLAGRGECPAGRVSPTQPLTHRPQGTREPQAPTAAMHTTSPTQKTCA